MAEITVKFVDPVNPNVEILMHFLKTGILLCPTVEMTREELLKIYPDAIKDTKTA